MPVALTSKQLETFMNNRQKLLDELHSDEHYDATETLYYGEHDPFNIPMMRCDFCGETSEMIKEVKPKGGCKYYVRCRGCGNHHKTTGTTREQAILIWNSINPKGLRYKDFPMFGLANKTPEEARIRMIGIRRNLEIRENISALEQTINPIIGKIPPSTSYRKRLKLYLHWVIWVQVAIKLELPPKQKHPM